MSWKMTDIERPLMPMEREDRREGCAKCGHQPFVLYEVRGRWYCEDCAVEKLPKVTADGDDLECNECGGFASTVYQGEDGEWYCYSCILHHITDRENIEEE